MAVRKQYPLRIDASLWESLEAWAGDDLRSVNAQVEYLLREALRKAGRLSVRAAEESRESKQG